MEPTDAQLLAASAKDPDSFARFYDRYEAAVAGYFMRRTRGVCVLAPIGGWCSPIDRRSDPNSGSFSGGSSVGNGEQTINGLVPDGNRTVTLVMASGARIHARVIDKVYEAAVHGRIVAIIDHDATGRLVRHTRRQEGLGQRSRT